MSSHSYEIALFGEFFSQDLTGTVLQISGHCRHSARRRDSLTHRASPPAILNRITLHSESAHPMHAREVVFEPFDAQHQRDAEPVLLRARKELLEPDAKWCVLRFARRERGLLC